MDPNEKVETPAPAPSPGSESAPDAKAATPPADSSPAKDESKQTLLEAVRSAIDPKTIEDEDAPIEKKPAAPADSSPAEGAKAAPDAKAPDGDVSDDALLATLDKLKADGVQLNKIERFREVLADNRTLKAANEKFRALDETLTAIGTDARRMGLTNEDIAALFAWPRKFAADPTAAVELLSQFHSRISTMVGRVLPADLKQKVDDGVLDEATAKEVAELRATTALGKVRSEAETAERNAEQVERVQKQIVDSVNAYQAELKASDPDFTPEKSAMTVDALTALVATRGQPRSVEEARALAKEAYDTVTTRLKAFKPAPRAVANPTNGRRLTRPAEAQPKTMREAVEQALGL